MAQFLSIWAVNWATINHEFFGTLALFLSVVDIFWKFSLLPAIFFLKNCDAFVYACLQVIMSVLAPLCSIPKLHCHWMNQDLAWHPVMQMVLCFCGHWTCMESHSRWYYLMIFFIIITWLCNLIWWCSLSVGSEKNCCWLQWLMFWQPHQKSSSVWILILPEEKAFKSLEWQAANFSQLYHCWIKH